MIIYTIFIIGSTLPLISPTLGHDLCNWANEGNEAEIRSILTTFDCSDIIKYMKDLVTALHIASSRGYIGVDVNITHSIGLAPLHFAFKNGSEDATIHVAKLLLAFGADINFRDRSGYTALVYAYSASETDPALVQLLIDNNRIRAEFLRNALDVEIHDNTIMTGQDSTKVLIQMVMKVMELV